MDSPVFSALSLCRKAGALTGGFDAVCEAVQYKKAYVVFFCNDLSPKTRAKVVALCGKACPAHTIPLSQQDIARILHKPVGVLAVTNPDLAKLCMARLPNEEEPV